MHNQMQWDGHLNKMKDARLTEQLFYVELQCGKRLRQIVEMS